MNNWELWCWKMELWGWIALESGTWVHSFDTNSNGDPLSFIRDTSEHYVGNDEFPPQPYQWRMLRIHNLMASLIENDGTLTLENKKWMALPNHIKLLASNHVRIDYYWDLPNVIFTLTEKGLLFWKDLVKIEKENNQ